MHKADPKLQLNYGDLQRKIDDLDKHLRALNDGELPDVPKSIHEQLDAFLSQVATENDGAAATAKVSNGKSGGSGKKGNNSNTLNGSFLQKEKEFGNAAPKG